LKGLAIELDDGFHVTLKAAAAPDRGWRRFAQLDVMRV